MSGGFNMDDYVGVNERIIAFREKYPEGVLQSEIIELSEKRVVIRALAYRTPDDIRPGIGHSALGIPGTTPYTRGSELENAETSAWGRAIAALGFEVKKSVASRNEIESKSGSNGATTPTVPMNGQAAPYRPNFPSHTAEALPGTALKVVQIVSKSGVNNKGKWTKYGIVTEGGEVYSTFSETVMTDAAYAKDHGLGVVIEAHKTQYGNDIDSLTVADGKNPDPTVGAPTFDPDEIPA